MEGFPSVGIEYKKSNECDRSACVSIVLSLRQLLKNENMCALHIHTIDFCRSHNKQGKYTEEWVSSFFSFRSSSENWCFVLMTINTFRYSLFHVKMFAGLIFSAFRVERKGKGFYVLRLRKKDKNQNNALVWEQRGVLITAVNWNLWKVYVPCAHSTVRQIQRERKSSLIYYRRQ